MNKITISGFRLKTLLLLGLILAFIIVVTIVLFFYAEGKRIGDDGKLVDTGSIRLYATPDDVDAFINGKEQDINNNLISGIEPGRVTLGLSKEGYSEWEKVLVIEANVVEDVFAQLFPKELNFTQLTTTNVDEVFFSIDPGYVFYTILSSDSNNDVGVWKLKLSKSTLDFTEPTPIQVARFDKALVNDLMSNEYDIKVASDNNALLLSIPATQKVYVYNTNNNDERVNLTQRFGFSPDRVDWYRNSESIVVLKDNLVFEYELRSTQMNVVTYSVEHKPVYSLNNSAVYYYDFEENELMLYRNKVSEAVELGNTIELPESIVSLYVPETSTDILLVQSNSQIFFLDLDKLFLTTIASGAVIEDVASSGTSLIYSKGDKYYSFILEETFNRRGYNTQTKETQIAKEDVESLYYSANNTNLIIFTKKDDLIEVFVSDYDGLNVKPINTKDSVFGTSSQIASNGGEMYLLLEDSSAVSAMGSVKNIYRLDLKVK